MLYSRQAICCCPLGVQLKKLGCVTEAKVFATETLSIDASLVSDVRYRGGAKVSKVKSSSFSSVRED